MAQLPETLAGALTCLTAVVATGMVWRVRRREATVLNEQAVWRMVLLGTAALTSGVALGQAGALARVLTGESAFGHAGGIAFATLSTLACVPLYQGLIHWNRMRTFLSDPGDWVSGSSAVLVCVAFGNALTGTPWRGLAGAERQAQLWLAAAAAVLIGTVLSLATIAKLGRDVRMWLTAVAPVTMLVVALLSLRFGSPVGSMGQVAVLLGAELIVLAATLRPRRNQMAQASLEQSTGGVVLVLVAGIAMLVAAGRLHTGLTVAVLASLACAGGCLRFATMVKDLTRLTRSRYEALTDELTGVPNRRALLAHLEAALERDEPISLLLVDLDEFKVVNDRYGHSVGDELLRQVAGLFAGLLPGGGMLARLGGDEFAVLLPRTTLDKAKDVAGRLAAHTGPYQHVDGRSVRLRASIGLAAHPSARGGPEDPVERMTAGELLRRADTAMYQAKASRAGVGVYDPGLDARAQQQMQLVEDLHRLLAPGSPSAEELQVYFQPQVSLGTNTVIGAEALVRWHHPRLGVVEPLRFIDLVEQNGLMSRLTARVVHEAVAQCLRWQRAGHDLRVSVNLSAGCLVQPDLLEVLDDVLAGELPPQRMVLEMTETSLMLDPEVSMRTMRAIADRGFAISIDDYGTGYSSLSYLNDLPACELKIDRSFVRRLLDDERTRDIVIGTIELAHRLGMRIVAEGVEDQDTLQALHEIGCDEAQGYLHSRPLPLEQFAAWLERRTTGLSTFPAGPAARPVPAPRTTGATAARQ
ncbi:putative bifunctional diguanylate cyclase/phosphodiesterase [Spongisporangium articulatum]|uniref:Bifunctional diguanylate cyclase/phosphodiesterase n=1 Tax=Spongisporangium articulatum TaxID=3362603 RepID=A0ABW8AM85_9ACTN